MHTQARSSAAIDWFCWYGKRLLFAKASVLLSAVLPERKVLIFQGSGDDGQMMQPVMAQGWVGLLRLHPMTRELGVGLQRLAHTEACAFTSSCAQRRNAHSGSCSPHAALLPLSRIQKDRERQRECSERGDVYTAAGENPARRLTNGVEWV